MKIKDFIKILKKCPNKEAELYVFGRYGSLYEINDVYFEDRVPELGEHVAIETDINMDDVAWRITNE